MEVEILKLKVKIGGRLVTVEIGKNETIEDLKTNIYDLEDVPGFMQILFLPDGKKIEDDKKTVSFYKLDANTVLTMEMKVREVDSSQTTTCNPILEDTDGIRET